MNLVQRYQRLVSEQQLFSAKDKLLLAVSGGVDSVVLCELCHQAGYDFSIAHCNFHLRGAESDRDEQFVKELGIKYGVETFVKQFDTEKFAAENKVSTQEAARELRYAWFKELINQSNNQSINLLTAHHADDNNETVLMHFFRGTGLQGLTGIPVSNQYIRRPLLSFFKEELLAFAKENSLPFVEDSSNESSKYTRNFFRNELIPAISNVYPKVKENLQDNIHRFQQIEKLYRFSVNELIRKICVTKGNEIQMPVKKLLGYNNRALIYAIISRYDFQEKQVEELLKLATSDSGKYITSPGNSFRIIKHRHWFIISPVASTESANIIIEEGEKDVLFSAGKLRIEKTSNTTPQTLASIASIDLDKLEFPLLLRKWRTSDYFYPLGMNNKKKKISRFLLDKKLSLAQKENIWVIESAKRIVWVVGYRMDERFKITDRSTTILQISLES
jgi:tRNA(Ile)-lysidine synthase